MDSLINFLSAHETISAIVAYYVVSAAIGSMPAPTATSSPGYQFWFKFLNTLGGNLTRAFSNKVESSPNFDSAVKLTKN